MKLSKFIAQLQELESQGHGDKQVFYRHGASGDCGELSSAFVTDEVNAMFSEYASRETKAVVAPIREAIHAQARTAVAEILETLDYARPSDEEN